MLNFWRLVINKNIDLGDNQENINHYEFPLKSLCLESAYLGLVLVYFVWQIYFTN